MTPSTMSSFFVIEHYPSASGNPNPKIQEFDFYDAMDYLEQYLRDRDLTVPLCPEPQHCNDDDRVNRLHFAQLVKAVKSIDDRTGIVEIICGERCEQA
jgi:hypothetical protein